MRALIVGPHCCNAPAILAIHFRPQMSPTREQPLLLPLLLWWSIDCVCRMDVTRSTTAPREQRFTHRWRVARLRLNRHLDASMPRPRWEWHSASGTNQCQSAVAAPRHEARRADRSRLWGAALHHDGGGGGLPRAGRHTLLSWVHLLCTSPVNACECDLRMEPRCFELARHAFETCALRIKRFVFGDRVGRIE